MYHVEAKEVWRQDVLSRKVLCERCGRFWWPMT